VDSKIDHDLRERVKVIASGKLINPSEAAWALCVGADFIVTARGFMFALGCIQVLQCNRNTCPTGITTHNVKLQKGLVAEQKSLRVHNYIKNMINKVGLIAHACGVRSQQELNRSHARIVQVNGSSVALNELYPRLSTSADE
jgi:glutamate synthase domain-containing protein 2